MEEFVGHGLRRLLESSEDIRVGVLEHLLVEPDDALDLVDLRL